MVRRLLAVLAGATLAAGCFSGFSSDDPARAHDLRVHRGTFVSDVVLTGALEAARGEVVAVPQLPSWQTSIKWIAADGAEVKQGERIVELDNSAFASNLDAKRQAVTQSQRELQQREAEWTADLAQKELEVEKKRIDYDKTKLDVAVPKEIVSARDYQDRQIKFLRATVELAKARDVFKSQKASVAADRANLLLTLQKAERELQTAEQAIAALILQAPRDGIVVVGSHPWEPRKLKDGDVVWVGFRLAQIPELSSLQVAADLADVDDRKIAVGMPAVATLDAYPSMTFPGRVTDISAVAQESARGSLRRAFHVVVTLDKIDAGRMRPGLSTRVTVRRATLPNALLASRAALDLDAKRPRAHLADGSLVDVTLGACNAQECVVTKGLNDGDRLAPRQVSAEVPHA